MEELKTSLSNLVKNRVPNQTNTMTINELTDGPTAHSTSLMNVSMTQIKFRCWTGERQVSDDEAKSILDYSSDAENFKVVKKLLDQDILKHIRSIQTRCRTRIFGYCVRFPLDNVIAVPFAARSIVEELVAEYKTKLSEAIHTLIYGGEIKLSAKKAKYVPGYSELMRLAQIELGKDYRDSDYPSVGALQEKFSIDLMPWFDLSASKGSSGDGMSLIIDQFKDEATAALKAEFYTLVKKIVDRLSDEYDSETGAIKKKKLHNGMMENLQHFLGWVDALNVGDDAALASLVGKCRQALVANQVMTAATDGSNMHDAPNNGDVEWAMKKVRTSTPFRNQMRIAFAELADQFEVEDASSGKQIKKKADQFDPFIVHDEKIVQVDSNVLEAQMMAVVEGPDFTPVPITVDHKISNWPSGVTIKKKKH